ncbi:universal stress protein [Streptomyces sp. TLI_171]|uniref:universal stress protein n=1 Tax=Streptomyces sp. TLI_171 TaxID=1938859 RepID=UPI000C3E4BF4|nr:universal stress protein [Streptomyces sp. TLI_171]RKE23012.1 nucleotide-binding universal stress UspA family protein [Streptomyces sp. TLI_171]
MTQGIVIGYDGSAQSRAAAHWAAAEAARRSTGLTVLRARPWLDHAATVGDPLDPALGEPGPDELDTLAAELLKANPGLEVATQAAAGDPADALVTAAAEYELAVLGAPEHGSLVGSVGRSVAAHTDTPVVLVPDDARVPASGQPEVVVGLSAETSPAAVEFALAQAERLGGRVRAVHAWEMVPFWSAVPGWVPPNVDVDAQSAAIRDELTLATAPAAAAHPEVDLTVETVLGTPAHAVLTAAATADLLVLGRPHHRLGQLARAAVHQCQTPVALVPHR